ncbi:MAG: TIGR04282 family arsenosugar biosynthesis glycosyltransferase [Vulcanimicrobiaceae bacterium]
MNDCDLIVVAKHPELGCVKTRLARGIGDRGAFDLYGAFIDDIVRNFSAGPHEFAIAFTPADAPFDARGMRAFAQEGATLNARLLAIFARPERATKTIVMSSDSPHVPAAWIAHGFAALDAVDVVLGPCEDGGYWCVGMREPHDIFSDIAMSTPEVLARTLDRVRARGLRYELLPTTFDVDELTDLARLRAEVGVRPDRLPATARELETLDAAGTLVASDSYDR